MRRYLQPLEGVTIEVIEFDPDAPDPLFDRIKGLIERTPQGEFGTLAGLAGRPVALIYEAIREQGVQSLARLCEYPGLGKTTLDRLYEVFRNPARPGAIQATLFEDTHDDDSRRTSDPSS